MQNTNNDIVKYIKRNRHGKIFFADEFRNFGTNDAVRQTLSRLCKKEFLIRLSAGIYLYPQHDNLIGIVYPSIETIAKAIAKREKTRLIPTGAYALNALGLSTQVPAKVVFLTDGTARVVKIGKRATVKLKRTVAKNLSFKGKISLLAVSALKEIGKNKVTDEHLQKIKEALLHENRDYILHDADLAPVWISDIILKLIENDKFTDLQEVEQIKYINGLTLKYNLSTVAIEKDWWISAVLRALFSLPYAKYLSFKGGTSLSKCWNLIERFSEDIDIAVNREQPDFTKTNTRLRNDLRRSTCKFVREELQFDIAKLLENQGINTDLFSAKVNITPVTTTDPEIVEVHYKSLFPESNYLKPIVKLEVSGRSMNEPLQKIALQSFIDEAYSGQPFAEKPFEVNAVVPERTFLEKICLLHEEFTKPQKFMRTERMSRHLYDLERMCNAGIAEKALSDKELYKNIVEHRRLFIGLNGFDYNTLLPQTINIIPLGNIINGWQKDYETMRETMIYGQSLPFNKLIDKIKQLNERINQLVW